MPSATTVFHPQSQLGLLIFDRAFLLYVAFVLSLVGGILILAGALWTLFMVFYVGAFGLAPMGDAFSWLVGAIIAMVVIWSAVVSGIVLLAAFQLRYRSVNASIWGIALIIGGALSFPVMGGFVVGALATIAAGILALMADRPSWRTASRPEAPSREPT